jgi:lysophospholipase L1-like esterase
MQNIRKNIICILTSLFVFSIMGQTKWHNPLETSFPVIQNQGWTEKIGKSYHRLPERAKALVREGVRSLSENAAGLAIHFYTNASKIEIRYGVNGSFSMPHMPSTGKSGVDLYAIDSDGKWRVLTDKYRFGDTISYTYENLKQSEYHKEGFEYRLFLPLYNSVTWMEIGVPDSTSLFFIPVLKMKPIVVYGTSIAQGGCASRPAMGWTNILSRKLDLPVINLGFSGSGPLEKEMVDLISELDASLIIYDCLPNMGALSTEEVKKRTTYGVSAIRVKNDIPILITDHIGYRNDQMNNRTKESADRLNKTSRETFDSLKKVGIKNLHYLDKDKIRFPEDGCVDNIHPNDLGMQVYADTYERVIREILNIPKGKLSTTLPVSQRREPGVYEWKERHLNKLEAIKSSPPKKVIIGNSIIHYWNDEPEWVNGPEIWRNHMEPAGFFNLGFGWDRIENVLWRVYHGELDGYEAEEIVVMIGTNNIELNSDEEIVEGLRFLLRQIEVRQPTATIKMIGILPRRSKELEIKELNRSIESMTKQHNWRFINVEEKLTKNGRIDETLFTDGLHPNEKGYALIAPVLTH